MTEREQKLQAEIDSLKEWKEEALKTLLQAGALTAEHMKEIERLKEAFGPEDLAAYTKDGLTPFERYRQKLRQDMRWKIQCYMEKVQEMKEAAPQDLPVKAGLSELLEQLREDLYSLMR